MRGSWMLECPSTSAWGRPGEGRSRAEGAGWLGPGPAPTPAGPAPAPACGSSSPDTHVRLVLLPIEDPQQRRVLVSSEIQRDVVHSCDCREGAEGDR